jgi:hypothetical protein
MYELADYLEQHLRRTRSTTQPRDSLWNAATALTTSEVLTAIARAAEGHGRLKHAAALYAAAASSGEIRAWQLLADLRERAGDQAGAEDAYRQAADACRDAAVAGDITAWGRLAELRRRAGDRAGAEEAYRQAAVAGDITAWGL